MKIYDFEFEKKLIKKGPILAIDEAGRGALAGPLFVCGVFLKKIPKIDFWVKDSKLLSQIQREKIFKKLRKIFKYRVEKISPQKIDKIGIVKSEELAIKKLVNFFKPNYVLIDGKAFSSFKNKRKFIFIVKGDRKIFSLASASVICKFKRDLFMQKISKEYPYWSLEKNKGYGTKEHLKKIKKFGICKIHRVTFIPSLLLKYLSKKNSVLSKTL